MRGWLAALAMAATLLGVLPAAAGGWVYPGAAGRDEAGQVYYPTSDGRRFESAMAREAYLRQRRSAFLDAERASREALRQRPAPRRPPPRITSIEPVPFAGEPPDAAARRTIRLPEIEARRQSGLARAVGASAATARSEIATARAERAWRAASQADRLQRGAAIARQSLGERERRPIGPLLREPRLDR